MKLIRLLVSVIICWGTACQVPMQGHKIAWEDPNRPGEVAWFTVYAKGPSPENTVRELTVKSNEVDLAILLGNAPSGRYTIYAVSTGTNGLSSTGSESCYINWTAPVYLTNAPASKSK
jgi:hypothetical protein